ncbi:MAG TPA: DUF6687 family protein [Pyrinomonadaceae bacterium]|nr:DUF6687 family protein [Pyrinomonadaceae bacterium]
MRFEFYHEGLTGVPKLSVDGTVENALHLSHWAGNATPDELRADTSTEIALNFVASPRREEYARGIEVATNNHFDTDGVLSVWTVLAGERALDLKQELISAAEAGDFSEFTSERAVKISVAIQGGDNPFTGGAGSPLARRLAGAPVINEARAYDLVLPEVERLLTRTDEFESVWRDGWNEIASALESFASGRSRVEEDEASRLSVVTLAHDVYGARGFDPVRDGVPFTAITHNARGRVFLVAAPLAGGWSYRVDYPYYSWAETVVRPRVERRPLSDLLTRLNALEPNGEGHWRADRSGLTSAAKYMDASKSPARSRLRPDEVATEVRAALVASRQPVTAPLA